MERHFEKDLNEMKERLLWMGSLAERAVHQSVHAVLESDEQLAKRVLAEEDAINELQMEVDDRVVQLLALHQLMATDLRFVLAVSRINNDLERIGDQAVNIAQGALRVLRHPRVKPYVDLPRMSELVEEWSATLSTPSSAATSSSRKASSPPTIRWTTIAIRFSANCLPT